MLVEFSSNPFAAPSKTKSAEVTGASGTNSKVFLIPPSLTESTRPTRATLISAWPLMAMWARRDGLPPRLVEP
jgi:hypothetical protein